jgi:hypothetical protein
MDTLVTAYASDDSTPIRETYESEDPSATDDTVV